MPMIESSKVSHNITPKSNRTERGPLHEMVIGDKSRLDNVGGGKQSFTTDRICANILRRLANCQLVRGEPSVRIRKARGSQYHAPGTDAAEGRRKRPELAG